MVRLADVAAINPRGKSVDAATPVSFVGMAELDGVSATAESLRTRVFAEVSKGYTVFRDRDILAAKITPCWENGKVGQAILEHPIGVGSTEFHVVRPSSDLHDRYLLHFLRQASIRTAGELRMTGTGGQRRVPASFLQELDIPMVRLSEQRRIASILDLADVIRAKRRRVVACFDALAQSVFHDMFGTADELMQVSLGDIAEVASGITKGRRTSGATVSVPYLAVLNVQAGRLNMDVVKEIEATRDEIKRYALREGDLVLTEGGDPDKLGRGTVWRGELPLCLHQNHIFRVRVNVASDIMPEYLEAYMASRVARAYFLRSAKQTTGIASINMKQLRALPVALPSFRLQKLFVERVKAIKTQRLNVNRAMASDDELFVSLQARAFRGEL